jgi:hypothetical protein
MLGSWALKRIRDAQARSFFLKIRNEPTSQYMNEYNTSEMERRVFLVIIRLKLWSKYGQFGQS